MIADRVQENAFTKKTQKVQTHKTVLIMINSQTAETAAVHEPILTFESNARAAKGKKRGVW